MTKRKYEHICTRISPHLKELLKIAAKIDNRSITNMIEQLIIKHCMEKGITLND